MLKKGWMKDMNKKKWLRGTLFYIQHISKLVLFDKLGPKKNQYFWLENLSGEAINLRSGWDHKQNKYILYLRSVRNQHKKKIS